ncbi:MAG: amidohydrolase family protein [Ignisphaera sp.]|uniref:Amidohydrolase-related domain-containing protein n=1 Tax=Ignisphaera aggregans TaxID=334771 RepID=A0A7J3JMW3_9CREN
MIVDFHVEVGCSEYFDVCLAIKDVLENMKRFHISYTVVTPAYGSSYIYKFHDANLELYNIAKVHKNLLALGTVNPWFRDGAVDEAMYIVRDLEFKGIKLIPYLQGFSINHRIVYPILENIAKHRVVVYILSGYHPQSPLEIADTALTFPELRFVMGFAGLTDFWMEVVPAMKRAENLYSDISCQSNVRALRRAIELLGSSRFIFATSSPYSSFPIEERKLSLLELSEYDREGILYRNAKTLLGL